MDVLGREIGNFSWPVCTSFEKRILGNQLCYQIDVNKFKDNITKSANLKKIGLSLLVDVNAEYDIEGLLTPPANTIFKDFTEEFVRFEESEKIMIHLDTISTSDTPPDLLTSFAPV